MILKKESFDALSSYDTDEEGAVLKFINVKEMHICPCDDSEVSWLFGSGLKLTPSNSLFSV